VRSGTDEVQRDLPLVRPVAVLEQKNSLPGSERHAPRVHRNGYLHPGERSPQVGRHVVRSFVIVLVPARIFRGQHGEVALEILAHRAGSVLLDEERRGGVPAKEREQPGRDALTLEPGAHFIRDLQQAATRSAKCQLPSNIAQDGLTVPSCRLLRPRQASSAASLR